MNTLLPIVTGSQNGANAFNASKSIKGPVGQGLSKEASSSGLPLPVDSSQILEGQGEASTFLKQLQGIVSTRIQEDTASSDVSESRHSGKFVDVEVPDTANQLVSDSPIPGILTPAEAPLLSSPVLEVLAESEKLHPVRIQDVSRNGPNVLKPEGAETPLNGRSTVVPPIEGLPIPPNTVLQNRRFAASTEQSILGFARQDVVGEPTPSGAPTISLSKVLEGGLPPQPVAQGSGEKPSAVLANREGEALARTLSPIGKDVSGVPELIGRATSKTDTEKFPIMQQPSSTLPGQLSPGLSQYSPLVLASSAEGKAGFTESATVSPAVIKQIAGNPPVLPVLKDAFVAVNEHRVAVPVDRHGETGLLGKAEQVQQVLETSVKTLGLDTQSGQSFGGGMNHSPHSQSGFQQSSSFSGQGGMMRGLAERGPELPAPALQRLQMDVQLSETQRVQIDVGVHNRQVYTGLVMDHSVLRNLAAQFVPQLENQLAEVDLELQEFSAEVRDGREQDAETLFQDRQSHESRKSSGPSPGGSSSALNALQRSEERGLHLVA